MTLLKMSLTGAVLILLVALIRQLAQGRMPKGIFPLLWGVVLLRLLIPFPALLPVSLPLPAALTARSGEAGIKPTPVPDPEPTPDRTGTEEAMPAYLTADGTGLETARAAPDLLTLLWLGGGCLTGLTLLCLYAHGRRRFRFALPLPESGAAEDWRRAHPLRRELRLRVLPGLDTPMTYGLLRPVILLPAGLDPTSPEAAFALEHEYMHIRRLDALWKLLPALALAVHWFNPAVWLLWFLANRDLELCCDEAVLRRLGRGARRAYAAALVELASGGGRSAAMSFGGGSAEKRIRAIMTYRRPGLLRRLCAGALVLCLTVCALGGLEVGAGYAGRKVYRSGGLILTLPAELADLVLVQTPELPAEQSPEGDVVFRVLERESWELGQALHPGEDREDGLLFLILREPEEKAVETWTRYSYSHDILARWEEGDCYSLVIPTFRLPAGGELGLDTRSERWQRWLRVCKWANALQENLSRDNPDLTVYRSGDCFLLRFLAPALFGEKYTLRLGEEGRPYDLMSLPGAESLVRDLVWHSSASNLTYHLEQKGTPLLISRESERSLYFWPGSERALYRYRLNTDSVASYDEILTFLDGREGTVSDLLLDWFLSVTAES